MHISDVSLAYHTNGNHSYKYNVLIRGHFYIITALVIFKYSKH